MPRKNKPEIFSAGLSVARVKEDTRMPRSQDLLTNVIRRNTVQSAFPNPYTRGVFEQGFIQQSIFGLLHQNLYLNRNVHDNHQHHYYDGDHDDYDDYDDDDDDDDYDDEYEDAQSNASSPLPPHPSLRLLTQEEADKHTKEEQEREERRKAKIERQKLKKLRRKEKKRLEKELINTRRCELEQNQPSGSNDENVIQNTSKIKTEQSDVDAETEDKSVDGDSTRSSEEPEERMKAADIKSFISSSPRGQSRSPVPGEKKGGVRRKKKTKNTTSRERRRPDRVESPAISQTPPRPRDASADKKENMNGTLEVYSQKTAELAACGHRLASCGQYEQALEYFTEAIKYNPKEYKLFGNRSFCYERLQQYESALQDSEVALSLEPGWIKGHFRQGKALCGLKRYYEASLTYKNILRQESSSVEAASELKRAQSLHLMEMGFSWTEACEALKEHGTLEEALEALFIGGAEPEEGCCRDTKTQLVKEEEEVEEEDEEERGEEDEGWTVLGRSRPHQARRRNAAPLKPVTEAPVRNAPKWEMYSVWVGSMAPTLTIPALHNLFNRAGHVTSVKMLVEQQCAFINYTRMEDCDRAIQLMDGLVVEGTPLAVRYPNRFLNEMNGQDGYPLPASKNLKECFFWRTNGCIKTVGCIFKHIPEHKHIDRDKLRP
ncbi:unnamed protein product [Gadus morhua 'NCC']